jgi:predicted O-methyltransferase YrrM
MLRLQEPYNQFSEHDEKTLAGLVNKVVSGILCEIGCWTGHSTAILAKHSETIGTKMIVVDNFGGNEGTPLIEYARDNSVKEIFLENMRELGLLDSINLFDMNSNEAHKYLDNESLSFLFVDAGHTYEQVKNDLNNYIPKVKSGGVICGHDYESNTFDERYINEDYVDGKHHGVIKAVNEVLGSVSYEGRMWWTFKE